MPANTVQFDSARGGRHFGAVVLQFLALLLLPLRLDGDSTISENDRHAYGANIGWVDARPSAADGMAMGEFLVSGYLYSANCGWISLGDGFPANGYAYGNDAADDWGVNHDGAGNLRGFAYGANIGWIQFEETGDPKFDLLTGQLSGYAYSANVGWIQLGSDTVFIRSESFDAGPDEDGDGIDDRWEQRISGGLTTLGTTATADTDGDGRGDLEEFRAGTDPLDDDSKFEITACDFSGEEVELTFTTTPARNYVIEMNGDLGGDAWNDSGLSKFRPDASGSTTKSFSLDGGAAATEQFFRVVAKLPLAP